MDPSAIDVTFDRILSVYTALGFPPELVAHWSLPRPDAARLVAELTAAQPTNILEVGTFVGFSTLLMATYAPRAAIHTVDPNFPLRVELDAMHTETADADVSLQPQDVAQRAAETLQLASQLTFHAGGFSVGATFSSMKREPTETVPIIGPEVCERHGPFDCIFIDGLHYEHAVLSDLRLAGRHLAPGGRIVLHDLIGMWGSNVRRAVYRFLLERPDLALRHGTYAAIYDAIGVIEARAAAASRPAAPSRSRLLAHPELVTHLAATIVDLCQPRSVLCFGDAGGLLEELRRFGVAETHEVGPRPAAGGTVFEFDRAYAPPARVDLAIALGTGDHLDAQRREHLLASCIAAADTVMWAGSPPGETGEAGPEAQPVAWWAERFLRHGYVFEDVVRGHLEPLRFAFSFAPTYPVGSSELANLQLVRRLDVADGDARRAALERLLVAKESRLEDLIVQGVFSDAVLQDTLKKWQDSQRLYEQTAAALGDQQRAHDATTRRLASVQPELAGIDRDLQALMTRLERLRAKTAREETLEAARAVRAGIRALQERLGWEAAPPPADDDDDEGGWIERLRHALKR